MLGKLIRYEWKGTWKLCVGLILATVLLTLVAFLTFQTPFWQSAFSDSGVTTMTVLDVLALLYLVFYFFALVAVYCGIIIYLGIHFYKTMYTEEGYLTHTLPVRSWQLLSSRLLVSCIWTLLGTIAILLSCFVLVLGVVMSALAAAGTSLGEFMSMYRYEISLVMTLLFGEVTAVDVLGVVVQGILSTVHLVMVLLGAITLGQLSAKHKALMSIVSYFLLNLGLSVITSLIVTPVTYMASESIIEDSSGLLEAFSVSTLMESVLNVIIIVVLFVLSNYIIKRKLNLE